MVVHVVVVVVIIVITTKINSKYLQRTHALAVVISHAILHQDVPWISVALYACGGNTY